MNDFVLSCCSTADLTAEHFAARDIHYICFHYSLNGKQYADDLGKSMPFDQFYQAMADGAETQTSQVNVEEFTAYFTPFLEQGKIFCMSRFPRVSRAYTIPPVWRGKNFCKNTRIGKSIL